MKHVGSLESTQEARVASNPKQSSNNIALIKVLHCAHISQANTCLLMNIKEHFSLFLEM